MMNTVLKATLITALITGPVLAADGAGKVELSDLHFATTGNGLQQLEGTGTNVSNKPVKSVFVKFNLLQNGAVVGNTIAMAENLEPGQQWKIQAPFNSLSIKPDSFKVTELTVFNN
ncbi:FxLYD domain-containing protein [Citrobacter sp. CK183]|uniref:FxLYD domain-containing protein n=1 Tax=Citrobacter sp. CK183 TaxID=2985092 RepID=UPI002578C407|nr:FxLYD domain-containing protein [Citrobacter sp. CK183]MDM3052559.1 FxLYD domain-containing protein [Citrobacter sp. CK183]